MITPHGGELKRLLVDDDRAAELKTESRDWPSWDLTPAQAGDLELLLSGAYSPLSGYLTRSDYDSVVKSMLLADGVLWPMPVVLDVTKVFAEKLSPGMVISLRDAEGVMLAALHVEDVWEPDLTGDAKKIFGTSSSDHPGAAAFIDTTRPWFVGGRVEGVQMPTHYDFPSLRHTPQEMREDFAQLGWRRMVAYPSDRIMHRAEQEFTYQASMEAKANLFLHPIVGTADAGDKDYYARIRCYREMEKFYPPLTTRLSLLTAPIRQAGPREALWHALINKNYGCTHMIVDPGLTNPSGDKAFYKESAYAELWQKHGDAAGVAMIPFQQMFYVEDDDAFLPKEKIAKNARVLALSDHDLKERLDHGRDIPDWFTFPEIVQQMRHAHKPRYEQGFTVFFTGLSGAGKSTIANVLLVKLMQLGGRPVTLLDGDIVRKNLSSELGFSKEHRDINIRRIGFVASEITKNGGIAICAPIAPYDNVRKEVRRMVEPGGGFVLVHVATPLETCEERDRKGLYEKARAGIIKEFTGISDPYEPPDDAELALDTTELSPEEAVWEVLMHLEREGYIGVKRHEVQ
ncbi:bifunctional sulfate adenylyltransferase/adenylylsulfate kinase [candidate division GN15 bacterium]|nr:bifunctional sulfate adenylyltransferase/adenylylsulfate kinase [candidate division GN15 bacterium]